MIWSQPLSLNPLLLVFLKFHINRILVCCEQLAGISADDMIAVNNMRCLMAAQDIKKSSSGFKLTFDMHKVLLLDLKSTKCSYLVLQLLFTYILLIVVYASEKGYCKRREGGRRTEEMDTISVLSPDRGATLHKSYGIHNFFLFQCFVKIIL